jgi:hypothetical protein
MIVAKHDSVCLKLYLEKSEKLYQKRCLIVTYAPYFCVISTKHKSFLRRGRTEKHSSLATASPRGLLRPHEPLRGGAPTVYAKEQKTHIRFESATAAVGSTKLQIKPPNDSGVESNLVATRRQFSSHVLLAAQ